MNENDLRRIWRKIRRYAQSRVGLSWADPEDGAEIRDEAIAAQASLDKELRSYLASAPAPITEHGFKGLDAEDLEGT